MLARPETASDQDFANVETVIAHEYFHNWTGNRITCRDWFQLSLKEGLTVFRDACFTADLHAPAVKRIEDVSLLRNTQFREGVRFEEVSLGYPQQWQAARGLTSYLRKIW